jgi:outer membrane receptor for ferrienterochelin and colicins
MQPGNIKMLLTESTGIQTQQTSATSASTSIRIQGLDGKYTQLLKDGFPIYSGFASGLSILQIPPLDLKRVEVIKGSASTLYGGGAIAGLINLVTKEPTDKREISFLVNANQTKALDLSGYYGEKFRKWGVTLFTARNSQVAFDRNDDGFSDIPEYTRYTFNPRVFYYGKSTTLSLGLNTSFEDRTGGDMKVIAGEDDATHTYFEKNKSGRYATQFKLEKAFANKSVVTAKNSIGYFNRNISLSDYKFSGTQVASYSEINYLAPGEKSEWVTGANLWTDNFKQSNAIGLPLDYQLNTVGAFVQNNFKPIEKLVIESGVRLDYNNQKAAFVLPRLSVMYKFTNKLTSRLGGGLGYKSPTLFSEEAEVRSFRNIQPLV